MKLLTWELDRPQRADSAGEDKRAKVTAYLLDWQEGERERKRSEEHTSELQSQR